MSSGLPVGGDTVLRGVEGMAAGGWGWLLRQELGPGYEPLSPSSHINLVIFSSSETPPSKDTTGFPRQVISETPRDISQSNHNICLVFKVPQIFITP